MAIFQCLPKFNGELSEEDNYEHLYAELSALILGSYLLEDFKERAASLLCKLPGKLF